jgi:hypothetical protein
LSRKNIIACAIQTLRRAGREEKGQREASGAGSGNSFWSDGGGVTIWLGISWDGENSTPGSVDLKEIGAGETTQGAEGLLSIRVAEHDSGHERDFGEGDGF